MTATHLRIWKQIEDTRGGAGGITHTNGGESFSPEPLEEGGQGRNRVFGGGGTNLDLSESAIAAVDRYKESAGPGAAALACRIPPLTRQRVRDSGSTSSQSGGISILDFRVTTLSPQEVIFVHSTPSFRRSLLRVSLQPRP